MRGTHFVRHNLSTQYYSTKMGPHVLELPIRSRRHGHQNETPQDLRLSVTTSSLSRPSTVYTPFEGLTGARLAHSKNFAEQLELLAKAQHSHEFLRIYLQASSRCSELGEWFEKKLWNWYDISEAGKHLYEEECHLFSRVLIRWRMGPLTGQKDGKRWLKAFARGLPKSQLEARMQLDEDFQTTQGSR